MSMVGHGRPSICHFPGRVDGEEFEIASIPPGRLRANVGVLNSLPCQHRQPTLPAPPVISLCSFLIVEKALKYERGSVVTHQRRPVAPGGPVAEAVVEEVR